MFSSSVPQEFIGGTAELMQPKMESQSQNEKTNINSLQAIKNESSIHKNHIIIKEEVECNSTQLARDEDSRNVINNSAQIKQEVNSPDRSKESENDINNKPEETELNKPEEIVTKELQTILIPNTEGFDFNSDFGKEIRNKPEESELNKPEEIVTKELQTVLIPNTEGFDFNSDFGKEICSTLQHSQEPEGSSQSQHNEGEDNCVMPPSKQQNRSEELNSSDGETAKYPEQDLGNNTEPALEDVRDNCSEFEIIDIAGYDPKFPTADIEDNANSAQEQMKEPSDDPANDGSKMDDCSEFEIIDIAGYDPKFPTADIEDNVNSSQEKVQGSSVDASNNANDESKTDKNKKSKNHKRGQKRQFLRKVRRELVVSQNLDNIPFPIWNSLKQLNGDERNAFLKTMKEKFVQKPLPKQAVLNPSPPIQSETGPVTEIARQEVCKDLAGSFLQWIKDQGAAVREVVEDKETTRETSSNGPKSIQKFTSIAEKRKFLKSIRRKIYSGHLNPYNLPQKVWIGLKQISLRERNCFLKDMKENYTKMSAPQRNPDTSKSFTSPSNKAMKRNSNKSPNLPSHFQMQTQYKRNKEWEKLPFNSYSFERDFQNQKRIEQNIATTSQASPSVFMQLSQIQTPRETTMVRNSLANYYQPYRSPSDNFQTPNRESTAFSGSLNAFGYNNSLVKGVSNRSYYPNQLQSYNSNCTDNDTNFIPFSSGNTSNVKRAGPSNPRYTNDFRMQASFSQKPTNSNQTIYSSTGYTSKRELPNKITSYAEPKPKRSKTNPNKSSSNVNDDSIKVVVTDDSNPSGTMNEEQASLLTSELVHLLDEVSSQSPAHIPRFYNSRLSQGVFTISCADQTSFDWLRKEISKLPQLWTGAKLCARSFCDVLVCVFIPGPAEDFVTRMARLERQNPGLNTGAWKLNSEKINKNGQILYIKIDEPSVQVLKDMNYRAFVGLSCVTFKIPQKPGLVGAAGVSPQSTYKNKGKAKHR